MDGLVNAQKRNAALSVGLVGSAFGVDEWACCECKGGSWTSILLRISLYHI